MNNDDSLDVLDIILDISHIIGNSQLDYSSVIISDVNYDLALDILDVVILVNSILE